MTGPSAVAEVARVAGGDVACYRVTKLFDDLPCCHRSWTHQGRCSFLHGYERTFLIEFACRELEPGTGFVVDFSALKAVRAALAEQFDHTTLIAADDPELPAFRELAARGVLDLRVMAHTGMEGAAQWVYETVDALMRQATGGRAWVTSVEARENRKNAVTLTVAQE
jgi:6-pyruvoyltetrahydropterin/6-carboxytetrahydropterin synthase